MLIGITASRLEVVAVILANLLTFQAIKEMPVPGKKLLTLIADVFLQEKRHALSVAQARDASLHDLMTHPRLQPKPSPHPSPIISWGRRNLQNKKN
jgi:hypothetical protein